MAENPNQWGEATKVIAHALIDYTNELNSRVEEWRTDPEHFRAGASGPFRIAKALEEAGFLDMEDIWLENDPRPSTPEPPAFT